MSKFLPKSRKSPKNWRLQNIRVTQQSNEQWYYKSAGAKVRYNHSIHLCFIELSSHALAVVNGSCSIIGSLPPESDVVSESLCDFSAASLLSAAAGAGFNFSFCCDIRQNAWIPTNRHEALIYKSKLYVDLYSASTQMPLRCSDMDHTVLPANNTISAFTPSRRASPPFGLCSLAYPRRDGQAELTWVVG